jgi:hypothetical protein
MPAARRRSPRSGRTRLPDTFVESHWGRGHRASSGRGFPAPGTVTLGSATRSRDVGADSATIRRWRVDPAAGCRVRGCRRRRGCAAGRWRVRGSGSWKGGMRDASTLVFPRSEGESSESGENVGGNVSNRSMRSRHTPPRERRERGWGRSTAGGPVQRTPVNLCHLRASAPEGPGSRVIRREVRVALPRPSRPQPFPPCARRQRGRALIADWRSRSV